MHLVDTTLFFSPTSGGVKRYLTAKHAWLKAHTSHRHSILVPGVRDQLAPWRHQHRRRRTPAGHVQLPPAAVAAHLARDARCARARSDRGRRRVSSRLVRRRAWPRRRNIPLVAFFHSNLAQVLGRRFGARRRAAPSRATCARCTTDSTWCWRRAASCASYLAQLGIRRTALSAAGRRHRDLLARASHARPAPHARAARRCAPAGVRRPLLRGKESRGAARDAMALLGKPYHLLLVGGGRTLRARATTSACCRIGATASSWRNGWHRPTRWCMPAAARPSAW